eukprot:c17529_g1_i1 orf=313-927(-)
MLPLKCRQRCSFPHSCFAVSVEVESQHHIPPPLPCLQPTIDRPSPLSSSAAPPRSFSLIWRHRLENVLWIASAAFIIYYGDFRSNFFALLANDPRIRRTPFNIALACIFVDIGIILYLAIRLRLMSRMEGRLNTVAPGAIPAAAVVGLAAFILLSIALWPIWSLLTLPMLFTLFMTFVVIAPYVLPHINVKMDMDSASGLNTSS